MLKLFNSDKWAGLSEACLGCGTCTFVCPTCQCYDIRDFDTGHGVAALPLLGLAVCIPTSPRWPAGNPRLTQLERFRQRFMHKLVYFPANNDGDIRLRRLRPLPCQVPHLHEHRQGRQDPWRGGEIT